ncbi:DUF2169 domain-containing protein [Sorangium sp. So ce1128]
MRTIKPMGLLPAVRAQAIGLPGRACVSVSAMWQINAGGEVVLAHDGDLAATIAEHGSATFDAGMPKARGEVLVEGCAFCERPSIATQVRLSFGPVDKRLYVVGDRTWEFGGPSEPAPFQQLRVSWENALGGAGDRLNPAGKGRAAAVVDGKKIHPMPNVEWPGRLIQSPQDGVPPAGFGPLDPTWEPRHSRVGTYGDRWLKTRYPDYPEDFDPLFFNVAPEDQWLPRYIAGDEAFVIENMHPAMPRLEGALPGLVARAFVRTRSDDRRLDVPMHCDTAWFFPGVARVLLVWRGVFPIAVDDEMEVSELLVALERIGSPVPVERYDEVRARRLDRKRGPLHDLRDADLLPPGVKVAKPSGGRDIEILLEREGSFDDNMRRRAELELERAREQIRSAGLDPDASLPRRVPPPEELPRNDTAAFLDVLDERVAALLKEAEEQRARVMSDFRAQCAALRLDPDEVIERERRRSLGPPRVSAQKELETLRGLKALAEATGVSMPEEVLRKLDDPEIEAKLVLAERSAKDAYRQTVHFIEAVPPLHPDDARRVREEVEAALRAGESLAGRDLTGADLAGLDFSGADLREAFLESARLAGCRFDGAQLERAVLAHARAAGASFRGARLAGANLGGADLTEASFEGGADLSRAILARATLSRARLGGASLSGADLGEVKLDGADLRRCRARELTVTGVDLSGADLSEAELVSCNLIRVKCAGTSFARARLAQTVFLDVEGDGASFRGASLVNLRVVKAEKGSSFARADLREADLTRANLRGASLAGSDLRGAVLAAADLSETDLAGARLDGVRAVEARFEGANLREASFEAADLMMAMLGRASVAGASFERANLFRADGARMVGDGRTSLRGANVTQFRYVPSRGDDGQGRA